MERKKKLKEFTTLSLKPTPPNGNPRGDLSAPPANWSRIFLTVNEVTTRIFMEQANSSPFFTLANTADGAMFCTPEQQNEP